MTMIDEQTDKAVWVNGTVRGGKPVQVGRMERYRDQLMPALTALATPHEKHIWAGLTGSGLKLDRVEITNPDTGETWIEVRPVLRGGLGYAPQAMLLLRFLDIWPDRAWVVRRLAMAHEMHTRTVEYLLARRLHRYGLVSNRMARSNSSRGGLWQVWQITELGRLFVKEIDIEGVF